MSRVKSAAGLFVLAGVLILIAIAILIPNARSRPMSEPDRKAIERTPADDAIARSEQRNSQNQASESDAILKSFVKSTAESDRPESNAPRMQQKRIKMH
jgi:hypothetical protein